jgi:hypothetical protein
MKLLAFTVGVLILSASSVLAAADTQLGSSVQKSDQEFKALGQVVAPVALTDEQLAKVEGGAILANPAALPPGNPGTSIAATKISADVKALWFGKAAGK